MTSTPSVRALLSLDPALSPATTKSVFFETLDAALPPASFTACSAPLREKPASVPVMTTVLPARGNSAPSTSRPAGRSALVTTPAWRKRRKALPDDESLINSQDAPPEADVLHREQLALVRRALLDLRPEEQEVFLLRQNGEMTYEEIARLINIPLGTAKTRMRLALTKLRDALAPQGSDQD